MTVETSYLWVFCGLLLLGAEMLLPGVYLLWVGLAAILTGLTMMLMPLSFGATVPVFLVFLVAGVAIALRLKRRLRPRPRINMPDSGLVGRHGTLLDDNPTAPRVRLGDSDWAARLPKEGGIAVGDRVRVDGVDGNTLIVKAD